MHQISLFAESDMSVDLEGIVLNLNRLCKSVAFRKGEPQFHLSDPVMVRPKVYKGLPQEIRRETQNDLITCLFTNKPYDDNYFFHGYDNLEIISFSGWEYLTGLPLNNGLVYFIADILALQVENCYRHQKTSGCIYDFLWDKTGVDIGMRMAAICPKCLARLSNKELDEGQLGILTDVRSVLNALGSASKWGQDIIAYWSEQLGSGADGAMVEGTRTILNQNDFIPDHDENNCINATRGHISELCERYTVLMDSELPDKEKGAAFEGFTGSFFGLIRGWKEIDRNANLKDCEIDIIYDISNGPEVLRQRMGDHIYVECKNRNKKAEVRDISHFIMNLKSRRLTAGVFFSYNGISGYHPENWRNVDAAYKRIIGVCQQEGILVVPMVAEDIEIVKGGANLVDHIVDLLNRFVRV